MGNLKRWLESGRDLPDDPKLEFASFDDLDADLLLKLRPAFVLSPLIADNFDAHELAARLSQLGYQGQYRVSCPHLPRPEVVRRELLNANPALDVDIFHINALAPLEVV